MNKFKALQILVVANVFLTFFLFWILYSQLSYLMNVVKNKFPLTVPELTSHTTVISNPITGSFVLIHVSIVSLILVVVIGILVIAYFFLKFL